MLFRVEFSLHRQRKDGIAEFPGELARIGQEDVARKLLGDRRCTLIIPAPAEIHQRRAGDSDRIDAGLIVKAPIFDRDHRIDHDRRNLIVAQPRSEEHTSDLQSLMRISYAILCFQTTNNTTTHIPTIIPTSTTTT